MTETEYLTFKQAMNYAGVKSYNSLRKIIKAGLPVVSYGRTKKIRKTDIDNFMAKHLTTAKPQESK